MAERLAAPDFPDWLADQVPYERYLLQLSDGRRMHVMESGEGRPVVLFHGNPTWGYLYRNVVSELEGEPYRLIMPDLMGLGFSDRVSAEEMTLANHVRWMGELIAGFDLTDAIAVVQDWGGPIGLHSVRQNQAAFNGLVVMNTAIGPPKPGFKPTTFHRVFGSPIGPVLGRFGLPHRRLSMAQGDKSSIGKVEQRAYNYALRNPGDPMAVIGFVRMVPDSLDHPSVPLLQEVADFVDGYQGAARIVWGERDPVLGRLRRRIERQLPQAESVTTQAGHFLQEEVPDDIADAIRAL